MDAVTNVKAALLRCQFEYFGAPEIGDFSRHGHGSHGIGRFGGPGAFLEAAQGQACVAWAEHSEVTADPFMLVVLACKLHAGTHDAAMRRGTCA